MKKLLIGGGIVAAILVGGLFAMKVMHHGHTAEHDHAGHGHHGLSKDVDISEMTPMASIGYIAIYDAYARASAPTAKAGGVFLVINNTGAADKLVAASSDAANKVELHTHIMEDGIAMMREVSGGIAVKAKGQTHLKRGGLHVMLMGARQNFDQGSTVALTLVFEGAGDVTFDVPVDLER